MNNCIALGVDVKWYFLAYQEQEMKKFSFFNPLSGSKLDENTEQIQSQLQAGSPAGAPKGKTGDENRK